MFTRLAYRLSLALALASYAAVDAQELKSKWSLSGSDIAIWKASTLPVAEGEEIKALGASLSLVLYGYQIDRRGEARFPVHRLDELAYDIALRVPSGTIRAGDRTRMDAVYSGIPGLTTMELQFTTEILQIFDNKFRYSGKALARPPAAFDARAQPGWTQAVTRLEASYEGVFDARLGMLEHCEVTLSWSTVNRDPPADATVPAPPVEEKRSFRFEIARVRDYHPDRIYSEVGQAIDRGVTWLRGKVAADGTFGVHGNYQQGETAIALLTLLVCGVDRADPLVLGLMAKLRSFEPANTYEVGIAMMAMEAFYAPADEVTEIHAGRRGLPARRELTPGDLAWMQERVDWFAALAERVPAGLAWGYNSGTRRADLSNTQYAALGLLSAWRCGAKVNEDLWVELGKCLFSYRPKGGEANIDIEHTSDRPTSSSSTTTSGKRMEARGFGYTPGSAATTSMTSAGISTLRIVRDVLRAEKSRHSTGRLGKEIEIALESAWAWLGDNWIFQRHAPDRGRSWLLYTLYGVERAAVLCNVRKVNNRDWYFEGASFLVGTQEDDGSWVNDSADVHQTCFALLFLKRGTIPVSTGE